MCNFSANIIFFFSFSQIKTKKNKQSIISSGKRKVGMSFSEVCIFSSPKTLPTPNKAHTFRPLPLFSAPPSQHHSPQKHGRQKNRHWRQNFLHWRYFFPARRKCCFRCMSMPQFSPPSRARAYPLSLVFAFTAFAKQDKSLNINPFHAKASEGKIKTGFPTT